MQIVALLFALYVVWAELRVLKMKKRWLSCAESLAKMHQDKTLWYSGVLPKADEVCLIQDDTNKYILSSLNSTPSADFVKIKRWMYLKDIENL